MGIDTGLCTDTVWGMANLKSSRVWVQQTSKIPEYGYVNLYLNIRP